MTFIINNLGFFSQFIIELLIKNGALLNTMIFLPWQGLPGPQGTTGETGKAGEQVSASATCGKCNIHQL